ncbi:1-phosphofructokinase family hexose kinase [Bacteroidota bacterium]
MVLTVTLNPLLERRLYFDKVVQGRVNRSADDTFTAGGKGINVSRQLNQLDIENSAFTFLGGNNGKIIRRILTEEKIDFTFVSTKSETRSATLTIEEKENKLTHLFGLNSAISKIESDEFRTRLKKMIQNCSVVVFSGSSPSPETDNIFSQGIEWANEFDKISILDTYGKHLSSCIEKGPTVIHNNIQELESSLDVDLSEEKAKLDFINFLHNKNIKLIFLTDGDKPVYAGKFNFHYKVIPPKINVIDPAGSGDSFVAGIAYGLEKALVFDDFIKIAMALGSVNAASWNTSIVNLNEAENLYSEISISPIGKKMKIIDDSPNY